MPKQFIANLTQAPFLMSTARVVGFVAGVGAGKTAVGAVKAVKKINEGQPGIIVGPDFPQFAKSTFPEFLKWAPMSRCVNAHLEHPYTNKKELHFDVRGKDVVVYYGGIDNEESWAGPNVNWCWFDEGGRKRTRRAFNILMQRVRIGPDPQLWLTSTPRGVSHWMYDVFVKGIFDPAVMQQMRTDGYTGKIVEYFNASTEENKNNLDPYYYHMLMGMYSGAEREQELRGQFVALEGAVWANFSEKNNFTAEAEYVPGVPVEWWADDGFTTGHPRVFHFAQIVPPYVNVFNEYFAINELAETSIEHALKLENPRTGVAYPKPSVAYVDSSAAELRSRLWREDIDTVAATHDVEEGIKRTSSWILDGNGEAHVRFHPRCQRTLSEVSAYVRDERTGRPRKQSDNAADALRYGLWFKDRKGIIEDGVGYTPPKAAHEEPNVLRPDVLRASIPGDWPSGLQGTYALNMLLGKLNERQRRAYVERIEAATRHAVLL
jgi:hypothetical protein